MASIRASCPDCGKVLFSTNDITIIKISNCGTGKYSFICPKCKNNVTKVAESRIIDNLLAAGVEIYDESTKPLHPSLRSNPPINEEDIKFFITTLEEDQSNWITKLAESIE